MVGPAVAVAVLAPATAAVLYFIALTVAGLFPRRPRPRATPTHTFAVLIPARDEEAGLPAALRALAAQDYPAHLVRVVVVADNCSDRTAAVAREYGAEVVVRDDPARPGKGHAVAAGLGRVLADDPDVVLMLDADGTLNPAALRELDAAFAAGADAVQTAVRFGNPDAGPGAYAAAVGAAADDAIAAGRGRLGLSVPLRGMGMAFRADVLRRVRWAAFGVAEDAEYGRQLRRAGVRVGYCGGAVVTTAAPDRPADLLRQRVRWRAALRVGGGWGSKPLGLAGLALAAAIGLSAGSVWWPVGLVLLTAAVYGRATAEVGLTGRRMGLLVLSAGVTARLGWVAAGGWLRPTPSEWTRTPRATS
jgi:cellulose synthase/poly-beta-1,6-N-acetylglucosamine synthase-like glycosyltransferase